MSKVVRYSPAIADGHGCELGDAVPTMVEDPEGEWIKYVEDGSNDLAEARALVMRLRRIDRHIGYQLRCDAFLAREGQ